MNMSNPKDSEHPPPEGRKIEMGHCHCTETGPHYNFFGRMCGGYGKNV